MSDMTPPKMETFDRLRAALKENNGAMFRLPFRTKGDGKELPPFDDDADNIASLRGGPVRTYGTDTNAGSFVPTPRDKSEIDVALDTLSEELAKFQSLNFQLIKRLEPIMHPEYNGSGPVIRHETTIPLAQTINDRLFDLQIENWHLQSILERLAI